MSDMAESIVADAMAGVRDHVEDGVRALHGHGVRCEEASAMMADALAVEIETQRKLAGAEPHECPASYVGDGTRDREVLCPKPDPTLGFDLPE